MIQNMARKKAHSATQSQRNQGGVKDPTTSGGARRDGDPDGAEETQRLSDRSWRLNKAESEG